MLLRFYIPAHELRVIEGRNKGVFAEGRVAERVARKRHVPAHSVLIVVEQGEHHPVKMVLIASQLRRVRVRVCACVMCVCVCTCKQVCICACLRARARVCKVCRLLACARPFFSFFFFFFSRYYGWNIYVVSMGVHIYILKRTQMFVPRPC